MIGAGQLARMTQQAAVDLDVELRVLAATDGDPAVRAGAAYRLGSHLDPAALDAAATGADVVTFDHELVPPAGLAGLEAAGHVLRPGRAALGFAQDKLAARRAFAAAGHPVPAFAPVADRAALAAFAESAGWPVVLKARSGGYDGRGVLVAPDLDAVPADLDWGPPDDPGWLVEEYLDLVTELAVLVARRPGGQKVVYPVVETTQVDGICVRLHTPAAVDAGTAADAVRLATAVVELVGAVGICAVELFVVAGGRLLVNEVALRPHNSGHATIEANATSQFEQHLRAVLDWPLGDVTATAPAAAMVNVIGRAGSAPLTANLPAALAVPGAHVHLYGKTSRPGRKIGHVTALAATPGDALAVAGRAADALLAP
jgi:5-(carboxyamino)imidazole ribonucleotide synthase